MGLYTEFESGCRLTEEGRAFLEKGDAVKALKLLQKAIAFFDELLPKVLHDGHANAKEMAKFLADETGESFT